MSFDDFINKVPSSWKETICNRIKSGRVVPIISNAFTNDLVFFGSHKKLVEHWSKYTRYPDTNPEHSLPHMTQYSWVNSSDDALSIKEEYLNFLKQILAYMVERDPDISPDWDEIEEELDELSVSEIARRLNYPNPNSPQSNPLLRLAELPLPIYLTTSYHNFLETALNRAGKTPRSEICRWFDNLRHIPSIFEKESDYVPTPNEPLVYHLHGLDTYPETLVLTEDDHLDFLAHISKDSDAIHPRITQALSQSSLVMIGYSLKCWDFKVLFRGVIKPRPASQWKTSVAVQLEDDRIEKEYVKKYLRQVKFEVEWVKPQQFIENLYQRSMA